MRVFLLIVIMVSITSEAYAEERVVPEQECYSDCVTNKRLSYATNTALKQACFKQCVATKLEQTRLGLDYKGYQLKLAAEEQEEFTSGEELQTIRLRAECYKGCMRVYYDEDMCDAKCEAAEEECARSCIRKGKKPRNICFEECGQDDPEEDELKEEYVLTPELEKKFMKMIRKSKQIPIQY